MDNLEKSVRVLHIAHWSSGGLSKIAQNLALPTDGTHSRIIVLQDNGGTIDPRVHCDMLDGASFLTRIRRIRSIIRECRPNVIHVHSFTPLYLAVFLSPRSTRLVRTIHTPYPHFYGTDPRAVLKRNLEGLLHLIGRAALVCVSTTVAESLPWRRLKPRIIENGIDFDRNQSLSTEPIKEEPNAAQEIIIVSTGRLERQKNFPLLLRAFSLAARASPKTLRLRILGEGSQQNRLHELADELQISQQVSFLGHKTNPFPYLRTAHIYASTSLYEGFGLALVEAMGLGLPAIAVRSGTVLKSVRNMHDILIVEDSAPEPVSKALLRLVDDVALRQTISCNGMRTARSHYSMDVMLSEYLELYRSISS